MKLSAHRLRPIPVPKATAWLAALAWAALTLSGCDGRIAGTSVGTGNPTEIQVGFRDSSGTPTPVTGSLQVYASTQIPVPGFAPQPLLSLDLAGASSASLKVEAFQGLADSLWPKGSVENGTRKFNLVLIGLKEGFVLSGFGFEKAAKGFSPRTEDDKTVWTGAKAVVTGVVAPLDTLIGSVDTATFSAKWSYHLFLYGTGFASQIEKGKYRLTGVPRGKYQGDVILLPGAFWTETPPDSAYVFDMDGAIGAHSDPLTIGPIHETVLLPASLSP
jgi:hypothetical protein